MAAVLVMFTVAGAVLAEDYVLKPDNFTTIVVFRSVPIGGKVVAGTAGGVTGGASFALYYTGFEKERSVIHLRSVWEAKGLGAGLAPAVGNQDLTVPIRQGEPTLAVVSFAPSKAADNTPTVQLEFLGVDDLLQLQLGQPTNLVVKADRK